MRNLMKKAGHLCRLSGRNTRFPARRPTPGPLFMQQNVPPSTSQRLMTSSSRRLTVYKKRFTHSSSSPPPNPVHGTTGQATRQNATLAGPLHSETSAIPSPIPHAPTHLSTPTQRSFGETLDHILRKPRTIPIPRWISPRHQTVSLSEVFGHSSFVLVAVSYAVDDFLMLRMIAVAGSTVMLVFTYFHPHGRVLWLPFKWNALFIVLNSYRIGKTYWDRYFANQLPHEFVRLRDKHFYLMDPVDFARLVRIGVVQEYQKGQVVTYQGEANRYVRLVMDGKLKVLRDGKLTYFLEEANFVSESGIHAGLLLPGRIESCCTLVAETDVRLLSWDRSELIELCERYTPLSRSLKAVLSWDIIGKLKAQRILLASGQIDDPEEWTERRNRQTFHRYTAILNDVLTHPRYLKDSRKELNKYRMIHHIDDEHHNLSLKECGWTPAEYEAGRRKDHPDLSLEGMEDEDEIKHDWRWYLHDIYMRLFG